MTDRAKAILNSPWFIMAVVLSAVLRIDDDVKEWDYIMHLVGLTLAHAFVAVVVVAIGIAMFDGKKPPPPS
jgi:hypothetical protein